VNAKHFKGETDKGVRVRIMFDAIKGFSATRARVVAGLARTLGIGTILCGAGVMASCHSNLIDGRTPVYPVIDSLLGASITKSGAAGTFENQLRSDVETNGGIFEDPGEVTMHLDLRDVTQKPTTNNNITFNHYRVEYRRTDGRNVQGVDVPYAFEGASTFTVPASGTVTAGFVLVRVQAKAEPPLITLAGFGGGSLVISTIADVTFYGKDQTGTDVSVKGSISINFADWADPVQ
jgi:hypothetical protein